MTWPVAKSAAFVSRAPSSCPTACSPVPRSARLRRRYQITQFVTSCSLLPLNWLYHFHLNPRGCNGEISLLLNLVFNLTLLSEFFAIHKASSSSSSGGGKGGSGGGKKVVTTTNAVGEGKKVE